MGGRGGRGEGGGGAWEPFLRQLAVVFEMDYENEEDDFLEQAQRRAKRNFLHEEILESGYSGSQFTSFCEQERGADIDLWTFEELQDCVRRFKAKFSAEELTVKPAVQEEGKTDGEQPVSLPAGKTQEKLKENTALVTVVDSAVRPKLVEAESSPLDSPKEELRTSPKLQQTKTAYRSPVVGIPLVPKDPPKPVILLPHVRTESPKVPAQQVSNRENSPKLVSDPVAKREDSPKPVKPTVVVPELPQIPLKLNPSPELRPVSDLFPPIDGPASLLTLSDYSLPGHALQSSELSDLSGKLKVVIEK